MASVVGSGSLLREEFSAAGPSTKPLFHPTHRHNDAGKTIRSVLISSVRALSQKPCAQKGLSLHRSPENEMMQNADAQWFML